MLAATHILPATESPALRGRLVGPAYRTPSSLCDCNIDELYLDNRKSIQGGMLRDIQTGRAMKPERYTTLSARACGGVFIPR